MVFPDLSIWEVGGAEEFGEFSQKFLGVVLAEISIHIQYVYFRESKIFVEKIVVEISSQNICTYKS